jgi:hypothetical protein
VAEDTIRKIRGINPPPELVEAAERHNFDRKAANFTEYVVMAAAALLGVLIALAGSFTGLVVLAIAVGVAYIWINSQRKKLDQPQPVTNLPMPLHVYNREFTAPLADNSVVKTNIFFSLPLSMSHKDAQLDTVTEKEFLIFCAAKASPPSAKEIEDRLCTRLVSFQDENQIPVLRVEVSLHIHIPAPKPKGGGAVSV